MLFFVNMLDLYVTIWDKTLEVMTLYRHVFCTRLHFHRNCECDSLFIIFVNCDYIFKNTAQHLWGVSLKMKYELNFFHTADKR